MCIAYLVSLSLLLCVSSPFLCLTFCFSSSLLFVGSYCFLMLHAASFDSADFLNAPDCAPIFIDKPYYCNITGEHSNKKITQHDRERSNEQRTNEKKQRTLREEKYREDKNKSMEINIHRHQSLRTPKLKTYVCVYMCICVRVCVCVCA